MTVAVRDTRGAGAARATALAGGLAAAMLLRIAVGGPAGATSPLGGTVFAVAVGGLAVLAGSVARPRPRVRTALALGVAGAAILCAVPLSHRLGGGLTVPRPHGGALLAWSLVTVLVAVAEEMLLRGALMNAIAEAVARRAPEEAPPVAAAAAVLVAAVAFALLHLPMYGSAALPLDVGVGVLLGCLRLAGGGVAGPAVAHVGADLALWWVW